MITLKAGGTVKLKGLTPQMAVGLMIVASIYQEFNVECVLTSCNDSTHSEASLHYKGNAIDFRTHDIPRVSLFELIGRVRAALGPDFDVLLEDKDSPNEHLHAEYDPK